MSERRDMPLYDSFVIMHGGAGTTRPTSAYGMDAVLMQLCSL